MNGYFKMNGNVLQWKFRVWSPGPLNASMHYSANKFKEWLRLPSGVYILATPKNLPFPRIYSLIFCGLYETGKQNKDSFLLFHYYFPFFFSFLPFFTFFLPPLLPLNSLKKLLLSKVPLPPPRMGGGKRSKYISLSVLN